MKRFFTILLGSLLLLSCNGGDIDFGLSNEIAFNAEHIQRALTQDDIDSGTGSRVYVCGVRNNTNALYTNAQITRDAATGKWFPGTKSTWVEGSSYAFYGYAYNTINNNKPNGLTLVDGKNGLEIEVEQPDAYDESQFIDYLLSYTFRVANGEMKPIVQIHLEHAFTLVEVYVVRGDLFDARLKEMTFKNVYRTGAMKCTEQAVVNSGNKNTWQVTPSGENNAVYRFAPSTTTVIGDARDNTAAKMSIMCLPQQLTAATTLTIVYEVNEKVTDESPDNWVEHTATFSLYKYNPIDYQSGHRVVYTATVDSGVNLEGVVKDWIDVDYIEGTVLPEL